MQEVVITSFQLAFHMFISWTREGDSNQSETEGPQGQEEKRPKSPKDLPFLSIPTPTFQVY